MVLAELPDICRHCGSTDMAWGEAFHDGLPRHVRAWWRDYRCQDCRGFIKRVRL